MLTMREQCLSHLFTIFFSFSITYCFKIPPNSPCLQIFKYKLYDQRWYGDITVVVPDIGSALLQVKFSIQSELINEYKGDLILQGTKSDIQKNISTNNPILFKFEFPRQDDLPRIIEIRLNNRMICFGEDDPNKLVAIVITHEIKYTMSSYNVSPYTVSPYTVSPYTVSPYTESPYTESPYTASTQMNDDTVYNRFPIYNDADNDICGVLNTFRPIPLIINGDRAEQQPWLVALFGIDSKFFCAGNIISKSHVITAAHCVEGKRYILIAIGTDDISNIYKPNTILRNAKKLYTNVQYRKQTSHGDLAIIEMNEPLHFDINVRPLCLWPYDIDENLINGRTAVVAGWGRDERGIVSNGFTKKSTLEIVPQEDCSKMDILRSVLSDTTLCAKGLLRATGPCVGDSGGALSLFLDGRWVLRGVVSTAIGDSNTGQCDVENYYSVYSDVAKHLNWVRNVLENEISTT